LLSDAFNSTISISLKLKVKPKNAPSFQTLMEQDSNMAFELIYWLPTSIKRFLLNYFLSSLKKYEEKKLIICYP
jgi:hypothetical protein